MVGSDGARTALLHFIEKNVSIQNQAHGSWWEASTPDENQIMAVSDVLSLASGLFPGSMSIPSRRAKENGKPFFLYTNISNAFNHFDGNSFTAEVLRDSIRDMKTLENVRPEDYRGFTVYDVPKNLQNSFGGLNIGLKADVDYKGITLHFYVIPAAVIFSLRSTHFSICFFTRNFEARNIQRNLEFKETLFYDGLRNRGSFQSKSWADLAETQCDASQIAYRIYCVNYLQGS